MSPDKSDKNDRGCVAHEQWRDYKKSTSSESRDNTASGDRGGTDKKFSELPEIGTLKDQERSLVNHNPGRSEPNQSVRLAQEDKIWYTGRFSDQLGLFEQQKREAQELMARLNLDKFGNQKRLEKIALLVIRYIVERDRNRNAEEYWRITKDRRYIELMDDYDMDKGDLMRLGPKVTAEIKKLRSAES